MPPNQIEIARRKKLALDAIHRSLGTEAGEDGGTLFASHHLEELDSSYWQQHLGTGKPEPAQVIGLLMLRSHWGVDDADGIDTFDFCLPGDVSDYVLSVRFDESGDVDYITMES
jgi:hypothetical protein